MPCILHFIYYEHKKRYIIELRCAHLKLKNHLNTHSRNLQNIIHYIYLQTYKTKR